MTTEFQNMNPAVAAIAADILRWAKEPVRLMHVPANRAVKIAEQILRDASTVQNPLAAQILRKPGVGSMDLSPVFGDYIKRSSPAMPNCRSAAADKHALVKINAALQDGALERQEGIAALEEHEAAVHNVPDRWLFDERELASVLKQKHPRVYPYYVEALDDWVADWPPHVREIYPRVLAGLDRDRGFGSSPFFHFTSSDVILNFDGRTIRQSRLRFWIPAHSCFFLNSVGCAFVRVLRPDLDPIVVETETHSLVVTDEGFVDLNIQALGDPPSVARAELFKTEQ